MVPKKVTIEVPAHKVEVTPEVISTIIEPIVEEPVSEPVKPTVPEQPPIKTEGVTIYQTSDDYVQFEGKGVSRAALQGMRPDLFIARPDAVQSNTNFGTEFPRFARKGDIFVRVDTLPNKVFKFDGNRWIELQKEITSSYLDDEYVQHLVAKLDSGEYDVDHLTENEKMSIEEYLQKK